MDEIKTPAKDIYEAINRVMSKVGYVQKETNKNLRYSFASESALIAALRPAMVEEGIVMLPKAYDNITSEEYLTGERQTKMKNISLTGHFILHHWPSNTEAEISTRGEGADSGDKANNKAMTGSFKYGLRQAFVIETGDDPDMYQEGDRNSGVDAPKNKEPEQTIPSDWTPVTLTTLLAEHAFMNPFEAKNALKLSKVIKPTSPLDGIVFWAKHYRGTRDADSKITPQEAADQADFDYKEEIKRRLAEKEPAK
jgi:hypothetical protein